MRTVLGETLHVEVAQFGIRVLIVEPGPFRTEKIYSQPLYDENRIADYNPMLEHIDDLPRGGAGDGGDAIAAVALPAGGSRTADDGGPAGLLLLRGRVPGATGSGDQRVQGGV